MVGPFQKAKGTNKSIPIDHKVHKSDKWYVDVLMDDKRQERKMDSKLLVRECNINLVLITEISLSLFDYKS